MKNFCIIRDFSIVRSQPYVVSLIHHLHYLFHCLKIIPAMRICTLLLLLCPLVAESQAIISKWILNNNGKKASYWENTATGMNAAPNFVFRTSTDSADVLKVCYTNDYVWVRSNGLTDNMGRYLNPGQCLSQNYTFRIPRNPTVPATKTISPKVGAIGLLLNGIPIYGLSNANSWNGSTNVGMGGGGVWNVEVFKSEGAVLDTAFGAHPQQQGAYHTHATPFRLYKNTPSNVHSPLIGFAFDGYPVYGPYGYSSPMNAGSAVTRMKSGYSLRNITTRTTLPYGVALNANQYGPPVSTTYPIGTYCEDYEWLASNNGDLDKYNGRFCVTPEYPSGTYAYFTTINAAGVATFPYMIGVEYYGAPDTQNFPANPMAGTGSITIPSSATNCLLPTSGATSVMVLSGIAQESVLLYPQPSDGEIFITIITPNVHANAAFTNVEVLNTLGQVVYASPLEASSSPTSVSSPQTYRLEMNQTRGVYVVRCYNKSTGYAVVKKLILD
jgi:hypothetical protein